MNREAFMLPFGWLSSFRFWIMPIRGRSSRLRASMGCFAHGHKGANVSAVKGFVP